MQRPFVQVVILLGISAGVMGCAAQVGVGGVYNVPSDSGNKCGSICSGIGMDLSSVVVMANEVGCVCGARGAAPRTAGSDSAAGGMVAIMLQEQEAQQHQQQTTHSNH